MGGAGMNDIRCDRHIGEAHPPRCTTCDTLATEYQQLKLTQAENDRQHIFHSIRNSRGVIVTEDRQAIAKASQHHHEAEREHGRLEHRDPTGETAAWNAEILDALKHRQKEDT
jgi:hypothetical protein